MNSSSLSRFQGTPCNCCDNTRYRPSLRGFDQRVGILTEFQLYECQKCHLVSLQPQLNSAQLAQHYPDWLWQNEIGRRDVSQAKFKPVLDLLERWRPARGYLLDVGCGPGDFVDQSQQSGWQACGLEVSLTQVEFARGRNLPVYFCEDFMQYTCDTRFQAVVFNHVLEHVPLPKEYLKHALRLLDTGGILVIAVPNYACLSRRLFGQCWTHLDLPRHIFHYTPDTLTNLIIAAGGRVREVRFNDRVQDSLGARDSLRRWLQYAVLRRPVKPKLAMPPESVTAVLPAQGRRGLSHRLYQAYGNCMAAFAEAAHLADTFITVATRND